MPDIAATPEPWTIEPRPSGVVSRVTEVWRYRRMFRFFAERAVRKLYQRTVLGAAWIVLRPLIPLLVRLFVFGGLLGIGSGSSRVPYFPAPYFVCLPVRAALPRAAPARARR